MKKGYKAFGKNLNCRGFKYEENKEYDLGKEATVCGEGFHYCESPWDVLNYYSIHDSEFATIEDNGDTKKDGDKLSTNIIKIKTKIGLKGLIKACIDFTFEKTNNAETKEISSGDYAQIGSSGNSAKIGSSGNYAQIGSSGDYAKIGSSGDYAKIGSSGNSAKIGSSDNYSQIGSSGNSAQIGSSGNSAKIGSSGNYAQIGSSGNYAKIGSSGNYAKIGSSGNSAKIGSSGNYAQIGSSGNYAKIGSSGNSAKIDVNGKNSVCANIGIGCKTRGVIGTWITLAEYDLKG